MNRYYGNIERQNYTKALQELEKTKWLQLPRNRFLFYVEKGMTFHLQKSYDSSNYWLEKADNLSTKYGKKVDEILASSTINPMMVVYTGEEFEKFLVHYYKALNYLYLGKYDDALVEVRRITLKKNTLADKTLGKRNKYSDNLFATMLQAVIYEGNNDYNNAFIAYRNALDIYKNNETKNWYGVTLPQSIVDGFYRTGKKMNFTQELDFYKRKLQLDYRTAPLATGGFLYLMLELGLAPIKEEEKSTYINGGIDNNRFVFISPGQQIPIYYEIPSKYNSQRGQSSKISSVSVALPRYQEQPTRYQHFTVEVQSYQQKTTIKQSDLMLNLNTLAPALLKERMPTIILQSIGRNFIKALAQYAAKVGAESATESREWGEVASLFVGIFTSSIEKADTRSWQSLPSAIYLMKIPLEKGENKVIIYAYPSTKGKADEKQFTLAINGGTSGSIQVRNLRVW